MQGRPVSVGLLPHAGNAWRRREKQDQGARGPHEYHTVSVPPHGTGQDLIEGNRVREREREEGSHRNFKPLHMTREGRSTVGMELSFGSRIITF